MKYAVIKVINGHYFIHSEGWTDLEKAKVNFHQLCTSLWNATDVVTAYAMIADENLDKVEGYGEYIHHEVEKSEVPNELMEGNTELA